MTDDPSLARLSYLLEKIASREPAPASGSACGAVVAAAAALVEKAAHLSTKHWEGAAAALGQAHALRVKSFELIEEDAQAYLAFVAVLRAAKNQERAESQEAVGTAHARTIDVPLRMIRAATEVTELAVQLAQHGNPNLRADAVVAATLAAAAAESGLTLIEVNLGEAADDARLALARKLAQRASGLALSLRPQVS
ncbi:MAG: cyclodeaminase/cyclohydrolase family protein [Candidatus Dormibacteraceae bacterium]